MKKLLLILLLFSLMLQTLPALQSLVKEQYGITCLADDEEANDTKENKSEKKEIKDLFCLSTTVYLIAITPILSFIIAENYPLHPHLDILTPPPDFC